MQSSKFLAVAVLAMVIIPIGMGYVLAFDEVEKDGWRTVDQYNLSDRLLNSELPYYLRSTSPINNGMLLDGNRVDSPEYVSVGSTPSSIPVYTTTSTTVTDSSSIPTTVNASLLTFSGDSMTASGGSGSTSGDTFMYRISASNSFLVRGDGSTIYAGVNSIVVSKYTTDSGTGWILTNYDGFTVNPGPAQIYSEIVISSIPQNFSVYRYTGAEITSNAWSISARASAIPGVTPEYDYLGIVVSMADGTKYYASGANGLNAIGTLSTVTITGLERVTLAGVISTTYYVLGELSLYSNTPSGEYADPADGWRFPDSGGLYHSSGVWSNGAPNESVTMYVMPSPLLGNASLSLTIRSSATGATADVLAITSAGATLNGNLIDWPSRVVAGMPFQLIITDTTITITIIGEWPSMYAEPVKYGSVTVDRDAPGVIFGIAADVQDYNDTVQRWTFRVDATEILAGYYPATDSATLDIASLFGSVPFSVEISSVGVYGESITVGGDSYLVTDGSITASGKTFRILDLVIGVTPGDSNYVITFNGVTVSTVSYYPSISFDGVWSITAVGYSMESFTVVDREWIPGEYVLDNASAALIGIITCVAAFVLLALCRPFSGSKMLMLAIVCGGGALFYLLML